MKRVLLAGGGQSHALVLLQFARHPMTDVELILVTPSTELRYSGMLPGWVAGHYALEDLSIDLLPLAQAAAARIVNGCVQSLDLSNRIAYTDTGRALHFDVLSLASGATIDVDAIAGAREHALPLRPFDRFTSGWQNLMQRAERNHRTFRMAVIGGGAGGTEIALAASHYARARQLSMRVHLVTGGVPILPGHGERARRLMTSALETNDVQVLNTSASRVEPGCVVTADNRTVGSDATLIATGAAAARWLRTTGLALDESGFVAVNSHLQSSNSGVFAAGDTATLIETPRPKSGVYAVRAAPVLADNLIRALNGAVLSKFTPQRRALYLLTTGPKHAIASWGSSAFSGRWVWHWKDWIDRDYIAKLRPLRPD